MPRTQQVPGYGLPINNEADRLAYQKEAERRGHVYQLIIENDPLGDDGVGILYGAKSDKEAIDDARFLTWVGLLPDGADMSLPIGIILNAYRVLHNGKVIYSYTPPKN